MNINENYVRLLGCIIARNEEEFYKAYGRSNKGNVKTGKKTMWAYVNKEITKEKNK